MEQTLGRTISSSPHDLLKEQHEHPSEEQISTTAKRGYPLPSYQVVVCVGVKSCGKAFFLIFLLGFIALWQGCSVLISSWSRLDVLRKEDDLRHEDQQSFALSASIPDNPHPKIVWLMSYPNR
jgi:hypothetical protein